MNTTEIKKKLQALNLKVKVKTNHRPVPYIAISVVEGSLWEHREKLAQLGIRVASATSATYDIRG